MGLDRDMLGQLRHLLGPLATRIANTVARGVVQLVDDETKLQLLQVGVIADETIDGAEHFQPYGFSSVPLPGAEAAMLFPNGDRGHAIALGVSDRRYRPTGGQGGEVFLYTDEGDVIRLGRGHVISLATSGEVRLGSDSAIDGAIKGTQRNIAEQTFLTALNTAFAAINAYAVAIKAVADPSNAVTPALTTALTTAVSSAITAFAAAAEAAVSTKVKLE